MRAKDGQCCVLLVTGEAWSAKQGAIGAVASYHLEHASTVKVVVSAACCNVQWPVAYVQLLKEYCSTRRMDLHAKD